MKTLTTNNFVQKADGKWWIVTKRIKTEVPVNVPLLEVPMRLIKKYEPLRKGNLVFPVYSNQKSNDYLKEIATLCDIHKDVTFHVARHTFATTVTLENGVPIESVSKMLGHTNVQTIQIHARITERKINLDMDQLSKKLDLRPMSTRCRSQSIGLASQGNSAGSCRNSPLRTVFP